MKVEIDQSGRLEYTSVPTVIGDSLGNSLLLKAVDKQYIQKVFRQIGKPRMFVIETFSFLTALTISQSYTEENIYVIDTEYPGKDGEIKTNLFRFLPRLRCYLPSYAVSFKQIGKKSKAHTTVYNHYVRPQKFPKRIITKEKVLEFLI